MANNGMKGKFRDRLRLIVVNRYKKMKGIIDQDKDYDNKKVVKEDNDKFIVERVNYIKKRLSEDRDKSLNKGGVVRRKKVGIGRVDNNRNVSFVNKKDQLERDVRIEYGDVNKEVNLGKGNDKEKTYGINRFIKNIGKKKALIGKKKVRNDVLEENNKLKDDLKIKILNKIRNNLDNSINEIEILESELYFLGKDNDKELEFKKVEEVKKKINDIIKKIENIKSEYSIFRNNYYLEDVVDLDDKFLLDDILNYKYLLDSISDNEDLVGEYKLLDEYKFLCEKIDEIDNIKQRLVYDNDKKLISYEERDKKYDIICNNLIKIEDVKRNVSYEIDRQNKYLVELLNKVDKIDKNEYTVYKFKGLSDLIGNSLKYLGLMMVSPFLGFLPGIVASTIATKEMIKNARENLKMEEVKKVSYEAENFNSEINHKINDIDYVYYVIDDTLDEISRLKKDFLVQYNSRISGYNDTLDKINDIERIIVNNRKKVDIIKKKMLSSKKINEDKMIKVKRLNENR